MRNVLNIVVVLLLGCTTTNATPTQLPATQIPDQGITTELAVPSASPATCTMVGKLPDPACTPGAINPDVTQDTIGQTICVRGWTAKVRPPVSFTDPLKKQQMRLYSSSGPMSAYEEDHLVSLEIGGAPSDPKNLWPEPINDAKQKDQVENLAKQKICSGAMLLVDIQQKMSHDWTELGKELGVY